MRIERRVFIGVSTFFIVLNAAAIVIFLIAREPVDDEGWQFIERQRPVTTETPDGGISTTFFIVHDGLNFALFRRQIGGWEAASVNLWILANLPAYVSAHSVFYALQMKPGGTSKQHSDIATLTCVVVVVLQWLVIAALASIRRNAPRVAAV